jgi:hypothetical protein
MVDPHTCSYAKRFNFGRHQALLLLLHGAGDPTQVLETTKKYAETQKQGWQKWQQDLQAELQKLRSQGGRGGQEQHGPKT